MAANALTPRRGSLAAAAAVAAVAAGAALATVALSAQATRRIEPEGIPVRYMEGMLHSVLEMRTISGTLLAVGDLLQVPREQSIDSRMTFHFPDSSIFDETVTFTQQGVFAMESYHLVQRGLTFADDLDATISATGQYVVKTKSHKDGKEKRYAGTLRLPTDVSNGLVVTLLKNLVRGESQVVHVVDFAPEPRLVRVELMPTGDQRMLSGTEAETAVEYVIKPRLGALTGFFARALGKMPPDSHVWIIGNDVPTFVRFEGPLYMGRVWRMIVATPHWP